MQKRAYLGERRARLCIPLLGLGLSWLSSQEAQLHRGKKRGGGSDNSFKGAGGDEWSESITHTLRDRKTRADSAPRAQRQWRTVG